MAQWTAMTEAVVLNAMPTDMAGLYATWIAANPSKATRLVELVAETVAVFRDAVACNPANEFDEDETKIPMSGFRHALNEITFNLGMEMGVEFPGEVYNLITRAEIWLRGVQSGSIPVGNIGANATPSYSPVEYVERVLERITP
jgi:hypothetical protein